MKMRYWVYENWTHDKAIIHEESCSYCNHGHGIHGGASVRNGQWHGSFADRAVAEAKAKATGRSEVRGCKSCFP